MTDANAQRDGYKRQVRNYLINWRYQLRFTLTIVSISAGLVGVLGWIIMSKVHEASRVVQVRLMDPTDTEAQLIAQQLQSNDRVMNYALLVFGILFCAVVAAYGIVLTHKAAGPLFKIALQLDRLRDGKIGVLRPLRKGDQLTDFFEHFAAAHEGLRQRTTEDIALLDKTIARIPPGDLADELRTARDVKLESLK